MECTRIIPAKLKGSLNMPPSKSIAHRAVICGGLSYGQSTIYNIDYSDDLNATIGGMEALGAEVERKPEGLLIDGKAYMPNRRSDFSACIDCCESGTTLRMLLPLSLTKQNSILFKGRDNLSKRPLAPYYEIFDKQGIEYKYEKNNLNLKVKGRILAGEYKLKGDISSQFISGLMIALPLLDGDSKIDLTTGLESKGYVDLTIDMLQKFGVNIQSIDYRQFIIKGNQQYKPQSIRVEGDFSQAAFFLAAGALGSDIECEGLNNDSKQGDRKMLCVLDDMGCKIVINDRYIKAHSTGTRGVVIDGSQIPDLIPSLAVVASLSRGTTRIINSGRLRAKECDRLRAMNEELSKLGADIQEIDDGLVINGRESLEGGIVEGWNDHRVVMALAVASTRCKKPVTIRDSGAVKKSYPGFWEDFKKLGGKIN